LWSLPDRRRTSAAAATGVGPSAGTHGAGPSPPGVGAGAGPLKEGPLEETSSRRDAPEGMPGSVAVMRMTVLCGNNKSRQSWRTTRGTVKIGVESGCHDS
jgi:hypothetical protein